MKMLFSTAVKISLIGGIVIVLAAFGHSPAGDSAAKKDGISIGEENNDFRGSSGEQISVSSAVVTDQMVCDMEGPVLDYADGETLIFHHNYGLFIYDISRDRLDSSVNLKELGCLNAKEQINCEIFVTEDGKKVYLHPFDTEELYLYDVTGRRVSKEEYDGDYYQDHNMDFFVPLKQTKDCVDPDYTVWRSRECVTLRDDSHGYLYLESGSGMMLDLHYVVEVGTGGGERVRFVRIFDDQTETGAARQDMMQKGAEYENK